MNLSDFFNSFRKQSTKQEPPSHWIKCPKCQSLMYYKEVDSLNSVCPKCTHHFRIDAKKRIELLADENTFVEKDANLEPNDPLNFVDKKSYKKRVEEGKNKTGRVSSVISGSCKIGGIDTELVVFDFNFMGGSLGCC